MKKIVPVILVVLVAVFSVGCQEGIDKVLVGTWNVERVEGVFNTGSGTLPPVVDENPTGTITFRSNGRGEQNYSFTLMGTEYPQTGDFSWSATDELIVIERITEPNMEWRRLEDTDNKQVATYNILINANQSWDYTLTLRK